MKHFLIKYRFQNGTTEDWHREIKRFIAAIEGDPALRGKVGYRCMKAGDGSGYYHLASVADDTASQAVQSRDFFSHYKERTNFFSGGAAEVVPLELVAETQAVA